MQVLLVFLSICVQLVHTQRQNMRVLVDSRVLAPLTTLSYDPVVAYVGVPFTSSPTSDISGAAGFSTPSIPATLTLDATTGKLLFH
jgi:hypothetical protein